MDTALDARVQIYEHIVDNTIFRDPPVQRIPLLMRLNLRPVAQQPFPSPWTSMLRRPPLAGSGS